MDLTSLAGVEPSGSGTKRRPLARPYLVRYSRSRSDNGRLERGGPVRTRAAFRFGKRHSSGEHEATKQGRALLWPPLSCRPWCLAARGS